MPKEEKFNAKARAQRIQAMFNTLTPAEIESEMRRYIMDNKDKHQLLRKMAVSLAPLLLD